MSQVDVPWQGSPPSTVIWCPGFSGAAPAGVPIIGIPTPQQQHPPQNNNNLHHQPIQTQPPNHQQQASLCGFQQQHPPPQQPQHPQNHQLVGENAPNSSLPGCPPQPPTTCGIPNNTTNAPIMNVALPNNWQPVVNGTSAPTAWVASQQVPTVVAPVHITPQQLQQLAQVHVPIQMFAQQQPNQQPPQPPPNQPQSPPPPQAQMPPPAPTSQPVPNQQPQPQSELQHLQQQLQQLQAGAPQKSPWDMKPQPLSNTAWLQGPLTALSTAANSAKTVGPDGSDTDGMGPKSTSSCSANMLDNDLNWSMSTVRTDDIDSPTWNPILIPTANGFSASSSNEGDVSGSNDDAPGGGAAEGGTKAANVEEPVDESNEFSFLESILTSLQRRTPTPTNTGALFNHMTTIPQQALRPESTTGGKRKKKLQKGKVGRKRSPAPEFDDPSYHYDESSDGEQKDCLPHTPSPPPLLTNCSSLSSSGHWTQPSSPLTPPTNRTTFTNNTNSSGVIGSPASSRTGDQSSSEGSLGELEGIHVGGKRKKGRNQRTPVVLTYDALDHMLPAKLTGGIPSNSASIALKRHELVESPTAKLQFKDFLKQLRDSEKSGNSSKEGFAAAKAFALNGFDERDLPQKIHWRVCMELADLAKRENLVDEAAYWFHKVNQLQPFASQGWLEHAKMEEECGRLDICQQLLQTGLRFCPYNESLLVKGIKYEEQMSNHSSARGLLSRLKNVRLEKSWKTILEGALFEARAGNVNISRKIFKYLITNIPRHGPIYYEAYRLEEKCEQFERAMSIVEMGLSANPRYGPLWFGALRLYERAAVQQQMDEQLQYILSDAFANAGGNTALYCPYCLLAYPPPAPAKSHSHGNGHKMERAHQTHPSLPPLAPPLKNQTKQLLVDSPSMSVVLAPPPPAVGTAAQVHTTNRRPGPKVINANQHKDALAASQPPNGQTSSPAGSATSSPRTPRCSDDAEIMSSTMSSCSSIGGGDTTCDSARSTCTLSSHPTTPRITTKLAPPTTPPTHPRQPQSSALPPTTQGGATQPGGPTSTMNGRTKEVESERLAAPGIQCCHCLRWNEITTDTTLVPQFPTKYADEHHSQVAAIPVELSKVRETINRAVKNISRELVWKVYFEKAQIEERAQNIENARTAYVMAALNCLPNLRWKVWLGGARTELNYENVEVARQLLDRALMEVPRKTRALVLLECARLEEYVSHLPKAREILLRAHTETKYEWKVFLESILLEIRAGNTKGAIEASLEALEIHRGTGRLWAVLIQLKHAEGEAEQQRVFCEALKEVPKSGEVWCEGARMCMNPLSSRFNLERARQFLDFAIKFTPQYGDSFIEYLRLELLTNGQAMNSQLEQLCVNAEPNYGPMWFHCKLHPLYSTRQVLRTAKIMLQTEMALYKSIYQKAILKSQCKEVEKPPSSSCSAQSLKAYTFATGLPSLNYIYHNVHSLDSFLRRKIIFGSEQIYP
eukprot:TRINITY_DN61110_c0_g1_i1.p1 TRINITY_DN61110_c0_g1~~TRINITY_DN61110_c0_g1_i1.p1  ORF type:complete len:1465 (-),score=160.58 TRINITY_DN61110_c0_g1_i1:327-4721(-)